MKQKPVDEDYTNYLAKAVEDDESRLRKKYLRILIALQILFTVIIFFIQLNYSPDTLPTLLATSAILAFFAVFAVLAILLFIYLILFT